MLGRITQITPTVKNIMFILGFREDYKLENRIATISLPFLVLLYNTVGVTLFTALVGYVLLLTPLTLQYFAYRQGFRRSVTLPLYIILVSAVLSAMYPHLIIASLVNSLFLEDFTTLLVIDTVTMRRTARILITPITNRELLSLLLLSVLSTLVSYLVTKNVLVFIYPIISYILIVYSLILVPPSVKHEYRGNIFEEIARRIPLLFLVFSSIYMNPRTRRLGREAGLIGYDYDNFIRTMGGVFTLSLYGTLAISPLLMIFIGRAVIALPIVIPLLVLVTPYIYLHAKKRQRLAKIGKNQIIILTYLASMKSVSESFTNIMQNLRSNPNLAKLFGLENEARIYMQIYNARNVESVAVRDYSDTIPDDFYRDTVRSMMDIEENEGVGATFNMLVNRLREYTGRYIDNVSTTFQNIGGNLISVVMLVQTALPILFFLIYPTLLPAMMFVGGVLSTMIMFMIASSTLPDLPSEFIYYKERLRRASGVFLVTTALLTVIEALLTPNLIMYQLVLNIPVALSVAVWYATAKDLSINTKMLDKFSDLLILFTSSLSRHNSVEQAMHELSQQATFPQILREEFQKLSKIFAYINVQNLRYSGPYWYKYLLFLSSISAIYGITPRELYKAMGNFMLEFKRFYGMVKGFGRSMLFMSVVALIIMTLEMNIAFQFLKAVQVLNLDEVQFQGFQSPLPQLEPDEIAFLEEIGYTTLMVVAILNGFALAKINSWTIRDGRYVLALYLLEIILIYVGLRTNFGIQLIPT